MIVEVPELSSYNIGRTERLRGMRPKHSHIIDPNGMRLQLGRHNAGIRWLCRTSGPVESPAARQPVTAYHTAEEYCDVPYFVEKGEVKVR